MAANNFIDAVKAMHVKINSIRVPVASPPVQPVNTTADVVKLIRRYPQLLLSRTGK